MPNLTGMRIIRAGLVDGWREPYDLSTSTNVDGLLDDDDPRLLEHVELLDKAINVGQLLRAGRNSQPWREQWWPVARIAGRSRKRI